MSYYLASKLSRAGIRVKIVESSPERCREISERLPGVEVICGNASDQELLESEGLGSCDALVSLTGLDELNMIVSLFAISRGVPQVITKLGHNENRSIVDSLNLGSLVCPKELCSTTIVRYVRAMQNQTGAALSVHAIADGQAEAMEFLVDEKTRYRNTPLKQIKLKPNVLVVSIAHGAKTEIANGESFFRTGDTVVVVTNGRAGLRQLSDIFA